MYKLMISEVDGTTATYIGEADELQVVFADSRRFAEEWTYRFLASALADASASSPTD